MTTTPHPTRTTHPRETMTVHWNAAMITPTDELDGAPLLRTEVALDTGHGDVTDARLHVSSLGVFEATLNGRPVADDVLSPGWSSYEWRLRYRSYDVADLLEERTVLGLALGNGWYRGRLTWSGQRALYGDRLGAIAQLEVTFADGHRAGRRHRRHLDRRRLGRGGRRPLRRADHRRPAPRRHLDPSRCDPGRVRRRRGARLRHQPARAVRRPAGGAATRRCGPPRSGPRRPAARSSTSGRTSSAG